jgi:hypothetical protein
MHRGTPTTYVSENNMGGGAIGKTRRPAFTFTVAVSIASDLTTGRRRRRLRRQTTGTLLKPQTQVFWGGAQAKNIFWQSPAFVEIGANASMQNNLWSRRS